MALDRYIYHRLWEGIYFRVLRGRDSLGPPLHTFNTLHKEASKFYRTLNLGDTYTCHVELPLTNKQLKEVIHKFGSRQKLGEKLIEEAHRTIYEAIQQQPNHYLIDKHMEEAKGLGVDLKPATPLLEEFGFLDIHIQKPENYIILPNDLMFNPLIKLLAMDQGAIEKGEEFFFVKENEDYAQNPIYQRIQVVKTVWLEEANGKQIDLAQISADSKEASIRLDFPELWLKFKAESKHGVSNIYTVKLNGYVLGHPEYDLVRIACLVNQSSDQAINEDLLTSYMLLLLTRLWCTFSVDEVKTSKKFNQQESIQLTASVINCLFTGDKRDQKLMAMFLQSEGRTFMRTWNIPLKDITIHWEPDKQVTLERHTKDDHSEVNT